MPTALSKDDRNLLERVTLVAREVSERAARAALENLAVHEKDYRPFMTVEQRQLRNRLRARGRALGDPRDERDGTQRIPRLTEDVAYEQWHRLLFTRFLAENGLLHTDETHGSVPVTLEECEELAPELGARDGFDLACRFASRTLPGVFRPLDPVLDLRLAPNDEVDLRELLDSLPAAVFRSDDALGWTYQFWQAQRKDEVNKSGVKIGAEELPAVTQLFTEDYMVEFLLHNTLGAWWAGKRGPIKAETETEARHATALPTRDGVPEISWTYLRFVQDEQNKTWSPAAGTFAGWPKSARLIKFLDPCMGSGHFVVFALPLIARMRMEEEGLSAAQAVYATLRDNVFNLELDERCTQIAAFNVALTTWKLGGYQPLPSLHLACSGIAPNAPEKTWLALAGDDDRIRRGMARLHSLFKDAPVLGSLIDPRGTGGDLIEAGFHELQPLLTEALQAEKSRDADRGELGVVARGLAKAAEVLAGQYTLVATNVPYLGFRKQCPELKQYTRTHFPDSHLDLAAVFFERSLALAFSTASVALVAPESIAYLSSFENLRRRLLRRACWNLVAQIGEGGFTSQQAAGAQVALFIVSKCKESQKQRVAFMNAREGKTPEGKQANLRARPASVLLQSTQVDNPAAAITGEDVGSNELLSMHAGAFAGILNGDSPRFVHQWWELPTLGRAWSPLLGSPSKTGSFGGREAVLLWEGGKGQLERFAEEAREQLHDAHRRGNAAWGRWGIAVARMRNLKATLYCGELFDQSIAVISPESVTDVLPIWCLAETEEFSKLIRKVNPNIGISSATVAQIPFDLAHWRQVAAKRYPRGLPAPQSDNPTQWLFNGHPKGSESTLQVAVARLVTYCWPRQTGSSFPECPALGPDALGAYADSDGIVCLVPLVREQPAAARLRGLLAVALGTFDEKALLAASGSRVTALEEWLRDEFFEQHCELFQQRPFVWHIWDGRKDGFHALVNYHRLDQAGLKKLTYTYLGEWIRQQESEAKADRPGAADRLGAARSLQQELASIVEGEPPYDIFVRWKPLAEQSLGWNPDLNDGVRLNIRPFLMARDVRKKGAGVLRVKPKINWDKDRGREPKREKADFPWFWCEDEPGTDPVGRKAFVGDRWNSTHLSLARKRNARGGR